MKQDILYNAQNDQVYQVVMSPDIPLLNAIGVFAGQQLLKKNTYKHGGPVLVEIDAREIAIGKDYALQIQVEKF